jgi:hypothetical protein
MKAKSKKETKEITCITVWSISYKAGKHRKINTPRKSFFFQRGSRELKFLRTRSPHQAAQSLPVGLKG